MRNLIFVDLETTGIDFTKHEIIELACLVVDGRDFSLKKEYNSKIKPSHIELADPRALEINGYSESNWRSARLLKDVLREFNDLASGCMLAGWNVSFDWAFLEKAFTDLDITSKFDYHRIDVMSIAYAVLYPKQDIESLKLRKVALYLGIHLPETHRALDDIKTTYKLFVKLMKNEK